jgi:hypothetical protein
MLDAFHKSTALSVLALAGVAFFSLAQPAVATTAGGTGGTGGSSGSGSGSGSGPGSPGFGGYSCEVLFDMQLYAGTSHLSGDPLKAPFEYFPEDGPAGSPMGTIMVLVIDTNKGILEEENYNFENVYRDTQIWPMVQDVTYPYAANTQAGGYGSVCAAWSDAVKQFNVYKTDYQYRCLIGQIPSEPTCGS